VLVLAREEVQAPEGDGGGWGPDAQRLAGAGRRLREQRVRERYVKRRIARTLRVELQPSLIAFATAWASSAWPA
jgi:hypothetical protein